MLSTESTKGHYTDPWKSNQKAKTVVVTCKDTTITEKDIISIPIVGALSELIRLAKEKECGIDCDLYQLIYGIQLGLNL